MINAVQAELYSTLSALPGLTVYGHVPQEGATYPYVVLETMTLNDNDTQTENGFNGFFRVHVWNEEKSSKPIEDIQLQIYNGLHKQPLTPAGYCVSIVYQDSARIDRDKDGITYHGVQTFRIIFEDDPA